MTLGIHGAGAYAPVLRIDGDTFADAWGKFGGAGIDKKAVPEADEDALTMGWEAGRRALAATGDTGSDVAWLGFATTTPPLAESDLTARLGSFYGVDEVATRQVFTGSTRAGTRALFAALDADFENGVGLVIASDCPRSAPDDEREHAAGAGAAAFVVGPDAPLAVTDRAEYATPFPGTRFRRTGSEHTEGIGVTSYDRKAFCETLSGAIDRLDVDPADADAAAVQAPDGSMPYRAAGEIGIERSTIETCATVHELGDTGAASVPLSVVRALTDGADTVVGAAFGSGAAADAFALDIAKPVPNHVALDGTVVLSYPEYLRRRKTITSGPPEGGGAYVSVPSWRRTIPQRHRLVAGQCPVCDALAFPPEGACTECGNLVAFDPTPLPREGTVVAATSISRGGEPPEFADQQAASGSYAVVIASFETDGKRVSIPLQVVAEQSTPAIGDDLTTVVRRLYEQEGVVRYCRKVHCES